LIFKPKNSRVVIGVTINYKIANLSGKVIHKRPGYLVVETGGIGYRVFASQAICAEYEPGQSASLHIHQQVREDSVSLYGFRSAEDLDLFELLLSISGIGPKSALGILAVSTAEELRETIARGDPALLTKVSGIGRKTAERVILELRGKVGQIAGGADYPEGAAAISGDEIDALMALGYTLAQAREALHRVEPALKDSGERIKQALKRLGK
jgi:Holliday junction DNA helicase RuvA